MELQTPPPQQIVTDGTRLRQILWNLDRQRGET